MISISLDANALTKLIEMDPDFKFKLQQAVLQECLTRQARVMTEVEARKLKAEIFQEVRKVTVELMGKNGTCNPWGSMELSTQAKTAIRSEVQKLIEGHIQGEAKKYLDDDYIDFAIKAIVRQETRISIAKIVQPEIDAAVEGIRAKLVDEIKKATGSILAAAVTNGHPNP